ncbi:MAG: histone H1 [Pseudomonadota bacterium]
MDRFEQLKNMATELENDFGDFYGKGNKAAGRRIRKGMQAMKVWAQEVRVEVQEKINSDK